LADSVLGTTLYGGGCVDEYAATVIKENFTGYLNDLRLLACIRRFDEEMVG